LGMIAARARRQLVPPMSPMRPVGVLPGGNSCVVGMAAF
jgi:hypothetical protein